MKIFTSPNGARVKLKNRSVTIVKASTRSEAIIQFKAFDSEYANTPACEHVCNKGKVRVTTLKLSDEAIEALMITCHRYLSTKGKRTYIDELHDNIFVLSSRLALTEIELKKLKDEQ